MRIRKMSMLFFILSFGLVLKAQSGIIQNVEFKTEEIFPPEKGEYLIIRELDSPPKLDGSIEPAWSNKATEVKIGKTTVAYLAYDRKYLYAAFSCTQDKPLIMQKKERDSGVWEDDSVEIFIDTNHDHKHYYQFITNPFGTRYDGFTSDGGKWNSNWQASASVNGNAWQVEVAIPWSDMGINEVIKGMVLGFNLNSNHGYETHNSWSDVGRNFHTPEAFNHIILGDNPVILKNVALGTPLVGRNMLSLMVENKEQVKQTIKVKINIEGRSVLKSVILQPGDNRVELGCHIGAEKTTSLNLDGFDQSEKHLFAYQYTVSPSLQPLLLCSIPASICTEDKKMGVEITAQNIPLDELAQMRIDLKIRKKGGDEIYSDTIKNLSSRKMQLFLDSTALKPGDYSIECSLMDKEELSVGKTEKDFSVLKGPFD